MMRDRNLRTLATVLVLLLVVVVVVVGIFIGSRNLSGIVCLVGMGLVVYIWVASG